MSGTNDRPGTDPSGAGEPAAAGRTAVEPAAVESVTGESTAVELTAVEPVPVEPVPVEPVPVEPVTGEPMPGETTGAGSRVRETGAVEVGAPGARAGASRTVEQWLSEYGASHQNPTNKTLHWICVPTIVVSLIGLLWSLPVPPAVHALSPLLNWGTLVLLAGVLYYLALSRSLAAGMAVFVALVALVIEALERLPWPLWSVCLVLFVIAWVGQFVGHHYEGKRPSFFKDLQFLMIGPLWLLSFVYRKLGLPY